MILAGTEEVRLADMRFQTYPIQKGLSPKRADFLAANSCRRAAMPGFVLLVRPRGDGSEQMRIGYTVSKKVGNAVVRNRMKRRLRALAAELLMRRHIGASKRNIERHYLAHAGQAALVKPSKTRGDS